MTRNVYIVTEDTPGYMPEREPAAFASRRRAEAYAFSLARELRGEGYRVIGSARDGSYSCERDASDLGREIEIMAYSREEAISSMGYEPEDILD